MGPMFTDDDLGKRVESAAGDDIGVVTAVDEGTAYVELERELPTSIDRLLDWDGPDDDVVPLGDDAVERITADAIRLEAASPEEGATGPPSGESGPPTGSEAGEDGRNENRR